ncbi:hypothetical protein AcV5_010100 [Taiwanofungus camphoratus]|nr:hypothetical protein AcV5_010100 [Antrodia cinnamomea]
MTRFIHLETCRASAFLGCLSSMPPSPKRRPGLAALRHAASDPEPQPHKYLREARSIQQHRRAIRPACHERKLHHCLSGLERSTWRLRLVACGTMGSSEDKLG